MTYRQSPKAEAIVRKHGGVGDYPDATTLRVCWESPAQVSKIIGRNAEDGDAWRLGSHFATIKDAQRACALGMVPDLFWDAYRDMRDKLSPLIEELMAAQPTTKRGRKRKDFGDEIDVDRWLSGDPVCFEIRERGAEKQVIRLGVQHNFTSGADEKTFLRIAALGAAASELLERLSYGVEIYAVSLAMYQGTTLFAHSVKLKGSSDPLDPQNVLVAGIPALSRVFRFGVGELWGIPGGNYMPVAPDNETAKLFELNAWIGSGHPTVFDPDDAQLSGFFKRANELLA
jgi:hypothetical protein